MRKSDDEQLVIITAPHFVAGVCMNAKYVAVRAAPILKYMVGWNFGKIQEYVIKKHWKCQLGASQ